MIDVNFHKQIDMNFKKPKCRRNEALINRSVSMIYDTILCPFVPSFWFLICFLYFCR